MELSGSSIKKFLIFSQKKSFLIFQEMETPKKNSYIFFKESFSCISENGNPEKIPDVSDLIFQEVTFSARKIKRTHY